ncbi:MAG: hypothetical protein JW801_00515 [Bacteroidales bacterium]|nr:hypothetical protein [Bacteroidales bacterium]
MKTIKLMFISFLILLPGMINSTFAANHAFATADSLDQIIAEEQVEPDTLVLDELPLSDQEKQVIKKGDTTFISFGNKNIQIVEKNGQTDVKIKDKVTGEDDFTFETPDESEDDGDDYNSDFNFDTGKKFKGHWTGFEFGLNNYMDADYSLSRSAASEFLDINTGKSWNFNWNILQYSLGFGTDRVGLVTGLGLEWNNYHFKDTTSIRESNNDIVSYTFSPGITMENIKKNKLETVYLTVPLILEGQFLGSKRSKRAYVGVGLITGIKLGSTAKMVYYDEEVIQRKKLKQDFYLSPIRFGLTARLGYQALKVYANYYLTPLFMKGHGPEQLNPVSAGLVVSF